MPCVYLPLTTQARGYLCCHCGTPRTTTNLAHCPNPTCPHRGLNRPLYVRCLLELHLYDDAIEDCTGCLAQRFIDRRAWMCWSCDHVNLAKHGPTCRRCGYEWDGACILGWSRIKWKEGPAYWAVRNGEYGGERWRSVDD